MRFSWWNSNLTIFFSVFQVESLNDMLNHNQVMLCTKQRYITNYTTNYTMHSIAWVYEIHTFCSWSLIHSLIRSFAQRFETALINEHSNGNGQQSYSQRRKCILSQDNNYFDSSSPFDSTVSFTNLCPKDNFSIKDQFYHVN